MFAANVGYLLGLVFAYWLFFQSMFVIGALCPWCLTITVFTTVTFFTMVHVNVLERNLYLPPRAQAIAGKLVRLDVDLFVPAVLLAAMVVGILLKYGTIFFS
ncbi:hypothetical protein GCM10025875_10800 [Litorihabitans aurantiacus]|uniref:Vitamin K epoxide reductase domain-containing protein n=1 Tax=Litorihabitans aurantiacus TaxID=1930061 RepID=A0AA37UR94_9MICO|nr:vitamin K epoxide reductase family protein [Litorihabitans aurantiacus]GMA31088.1 hypothetical protein GCM10025875_10800 [Litorihabitans aurantiacus]